MFSGLWVTWVLVACNSSAVAMIMFLWWQGLVFVIVSGVERRVVDALGVGVLMRLFHRDLVDEVLLATGRAGQRTRLLPGRVVVYFVLGLCLFGGDCYEEVMRKLVQGLRYFGCWADDWHVPTSGALTRARARVGEEPFRKLFDRVAVPHAHPGTRGAWLREWRVMSVDGTVFDVPDTPENDVEFGRTGVGAGKARGPFPQARVVGLVECGTRAVVGAAIGHFDTGERELARTFHDVLEPGMLVIADRNFFGRRQWEDAAETGADLLWRIQDHIELPALELHVDGSYRSVIADSNERRRAARHTARFGRTVEPDGIPVRVIEYQITNRGEETELIRLVTTIIDPDQASAGELAEAYHHRWTSETVFSEIKTQLRGPERVLRSQSPDMVRQEIWAFLLTHYAISDLRREAADDVNEEVRRTSFLTTLRIIRRGLTSPAVFSPSGPGKRSNPSH